MRDIRNTTNTQGRALLNPMQQKKWDEMKRSANSECRTTAAPANRLRLLHSNSFKEQALKNKEFW